MKIAIHTPYLDTLAGGERYMLTIASCLQNDHEVYIFWNDKDILKKANERLSINLSNVKIVSNILKKDISIFKKIASTSQYDLIITLSDGSIPIIFAKNGILHFQQPFQNISGTSLVNKLKLKKYRHIVCNSYYTKKYIDKEFSVSSRVLYPPVDVSSFSSGKKEKIILSVGRFHPFKKQEIMIQAFKKFIKKYPEWQLVLAGGVLEKDASYFSKIEKQAIDLPIKLMPSILFSDLKSLYAKSTIYWHAAGYYENEKTRPENFEHFGISPVEAMASGAIPLVYNGGGLPEIVENGENGHTWETIDELVKKTSAVVGDSKKYLQMKKSGVESAQKFSVSVFCNDINKLIDQV